MLAWVATAMKHATECHESAATDEWGMQLLTRGALGHFGAFRSCSDLKERKGGGVNGLNPGRHKQPRRHKQPHRRHPAAADLVVEVGADVGLLGRHWLRVVLLHLVDKGVVDLLVMCVCVPECAGGSVRFSV